MVKKYKMEKVFDCQSMPQEVRNIFFETAGSPSFRGGNDCYVKWYVFDERKLADIVPGTTPPSWVTSKQIDGYNGNTIYKQEIEDGLIWVYEKGHNIVNDWLFENGAEIGDEVIVKHWW